MATGCMHRERVGAMWQFLAGLALGAGGILWWAYRSAKRKGRL